ncbi:MAG: hypothetical protein ABEH65_11230 [Halobacteriales archaeon]
MPECDACGRHVSMDYLRVFAPAEADAVHGCPNCSHSAQDACP